MLNAGDLDRRVRFERKTGDDAYDSAGSEAWEEVVTVWAQVQDVLPSRSERLANGINIAARPARVRIRYRAGIDSGMRMVIGDRVLQIVAGPAELGRREGLELMGVEYSTAGGAA